MGVFGAIGGALKAPVKAVNKVGKAAMKPAMGAMNKAPKPPGMGGMGGVMGKMGLGPSKPPMNPAMGAPMGAAGQNMMRPPVPQSSPMQMNPMSQNQPNDGNPAMDSNYGGGFQPNPGTVGPQQAMDASPGYSGMMSGAPEATGIGPSPQLMGDIPQGNVQGQFNPRMRRLMQG